MPNVELRNSINLKKDGANRLKVFGKICQYHIMQFFPDGQPKIEKLRAVLLSSCGAEGCFYSFQAFHPLGITIHEFGQRRVQKRHHVPQGVGKIIGAPPKFVGIVETV